MTSAKPVPLSLVRPVDLLPVGRRVAARLGLRRPRFLRGPRLTSPIRAPRMRTERLVLRPHRLSDAAAWYEIENDPRVLRGLKWKARTAAQSRSHLRDRTRHTLLLQRDDFLALAIEHDGQLAGDISLHLRGVEPAERTVEIGWIVHSRHQGRGFAFEGAAAAIMMAFARVGAVEVFARIDPANERSLALARRLGFEQASVTRHVLTAAAWERRVAEGLAARS